MQRRASLLAQYGAFLDTTLSQRLTRQRRESSAWLVPWVQDVVAHVPAYGEFLAQQGFDFAALRSVADFARLPLMTKDNYMRVFPLPQRCRDGRLASCETVAVSSGSTGTPMFWPRSITDELDIATRFEQVFVDSFRAHERTTLAIICFAMGTWVGGVFSAQCCRLLNQKGLPITVLTPGNNKAEILRVVTELGPLFEQIVLLGYPPFIKDVIDSGRAARIDWARYAPKLVFAGEVFSEEWRELVCQRIGASDPSTATASLYGTADGGVLGNETPLSITIRRMLATQPILAAELFGEARLPTLVQYDPCSRYFEVTNNTLVVSGESGVPLVRYHIADKGGLFAFDELMQWIAGRIGNPLAELAESARDAVRDLPFVYVFGRADFTVSYFGANVYPENISVGLEQTEIRDWVTGKFVLEVASTEDLNEVLSVTIELVPAEHANEERRVVAAQVLQRELVRLNSEYANYVPPASQPLRINLLDNGDPEFFPVGVKHRYTRKSGTGMQ